jgi:hypothetical protein
MQALVEPDVLRRSGRSSSTKAGLSLTLDVKILSNHDSYEYVRLSYDSTSYVNGEAQWEALVKLSEGLVRRKQKTGVAEMLCVLRQRHFDASKSLIAKTLHVVSNTTQDGKSIACHQIGLRSLGAVVAQQQQRPKVVTERTMLVLEGLLSSQKKFSKPSIAELGQDLHARMQRYLRDNKGFDSMFAKGAGVPSLLEAVKEMGLKVEARGSGSTFTSSAAPPSLHVLLVGGHPMLHNPSTEERIEASFGAVIARESTEAKSKSKVLVRRTRLYLNPGALLDIRQASCVHSMSASFSARLSSSLLRAVFSPAAGSRARAPQARRRHRPRRREALQVPRQCFRLRRPSDPRC